MEEQLWQKEGGKRGEAEEKERVREREREGGDSRDGTAIITDLLEEISTTQTGCPHHIEMIDGGGGGGGGVSVRECVWRGGASQRR